MISKELFEKFADKIRDIHNDYSAREYNFEDNYIDFCLNYVDTLKLTKKGYNQYETLVNKSSVNTENIEIYLSNDCSGYEYWTKLQEESNYLHLTITFKENSTNITKHEEELLYWFMNEVSNKYDIILSKHERKRRLV